MPPTHSLIALKQYMKGVGCLCGAALSGKGFSAAFLAPPLGELSSVSETERARSLPAALPSPSRLTPCHLPQSGRHWHIGSAHADRAKLCITQNAGPCRPDSQVRCCESRPQGPVVIVMRSDLPGLPRAPPLGELSSGARLRGLVLCQQACPLRQRLSALPPPPKWEARALPLRSWLPLWGSWLRSRLRGRKKHPIPSLVRGVWERFR